MQTELRLKKNTMFKNNFLGKKDLKSKDCLILKYVTLGMFWFDLLMSAEEIIFDDKMIVQIQREKTP